MARDRWCEEEKGKANLSRRNDRGKGVESLRERVKQRIAEPLLFERLSVISSP
jgi:hypothetical protein